MNHKQANIAQLRSAIHGRVLAPRAPGFDAVGAGFNLAVQHHPSAILAAAGTRDVVESVRYAAEVGLQVRVQATDHGIGMAMDGGLLVTTGAMRAVTISADRKSVTVAAGVRWGEVMEAVAPHGIAPLTGSSPTVGVVGYTLGGGMGPMARTFGFNSDRVRRMRMVDANGDLVEIDSVSEPDLFWALRGGSLRWGW